MGRVGGILKWLGLGVVALLVLGAVYQQIGTALDARLAPPPGQMVDVDGHAMHLVCMGQGRTTFVLDAGAGAGTFEWWRVQPLLAKSARVCAFDRQGLGWSAPSGGAHDGATAADRLAALVRKAKIAIPFVYVGHSLGANFGMTYYARHKADVSSLILIEPGNPKDMLEDFHGTRAEAMAAPDCSLICNLTTVAAYFGVTRLAEQVAVSGGKTLSGRALSDYRAGLARPSTARALVSEFVDALPKTAYENLEVHSFGDTPVLVFASSKDLKHGEFSSVAEYRKWRIGQHAYLASLAAMSTRGKGPVIVPDTDHVSMVMGETQSARLVKYILAFAAANSL